MTLASFPSIQEIPYSRLLQIPNEDEHDFVSFEELKPVQQNVQYQYQSITNYQPTYYELTNIVQNPCTAGFTYQPGFSNASTLISGSTDSVHAQIEKPAQQQPPPPPLQQPPTQILNVTSIPTLEIQGITQSTQSIKTGAKRKRKISVQDASDLDDDTGEDSKSVKTDENKKQNHSEIEKRRRDKMNTYIMELSSMIPMCHAMSRKLDKLTVLRMAVQHMKSIRGSVHSYSEINSKPSFLNDHELKQLILQATDGFLFVVGCDRGRIQYVSESVSKILNYTQSDLLGQSLFDILHPKDVAKVKEQLSSSDLNPRERLIDAKTMLPVKTDDLPSPGLSHFCSGARRSFFCRMKCQNSLQVKEEADTTTGGCLSRNANLTTDKKFCVIQCTGYLKLWKPTPMSGLEEADDADVEMGTSLVAVGRVLAHISTIAMNINCGNVESMPIQFISRHALDGKFIFVDQRATLVLGFLPQELLGTSMYEYYHQDDISELSERHKLALQTTDYVSTNVYRFRTKDGTSLRLQSEWKSFKNPWTKEIEYMIAKNNLILSDFRIVESSAANQTGSDRIQESYDFFSNSSTDSDMQRAISTHVEASKIGRQIAEQIVNCQKRSSDVALNASGSNISVNSEVAQSPNIFQQLNAPPLPDYMATHRPIETNCSAYSADSFTTTDTVLGSSVSGGGGANTSGLITSSEASSSKMMDLMDSPGNSSSNNHHSTMEDGNDEAAMAVIMSLLEADAGLGGPVDFSGLPWPLP